MIFVELLVLSLVTGQAIHLHTEIDLRSMSSCLSCTYELLNDISLQEAWMPVGNSSAPFTGTLDGKGNTIIFNAYVIPGDKNVGFFGVVKNAKIISLSVSNYEQSKWSANVANISFGVISGTAYNSLVIGCNINVLLVIMSPGNALTVGGIFGTASESFIAQTNVFATLTIESLSALHLGGLIGNSSTDVINDCIAYPEVFLVTVGRAYIGGALGFVAMATLTNVVMTGEVISNSSLTVGIIGGLISSELSGMGWGTSVTTCISMLNISAAQSENTVIGGIVGSATRGLNLTSCNVIFTMAGKGSVVGGAVGSASMPILEISNVFVNATIVVSNGSINHSEMYIGGLVGIITAFTAVLIESVAVVNISILSERFYVGGLIGFCSTELSSITRSGALGTLTVMSTGSSDVHLGGIIGWVATAWISQCYFLGKLLAYGENQLFVGAMAGSLSDSTIRESYALANVSVVGPKVYAGGIGLARHSAVASCYTRVVIEVGITDLLMLGGMLGCLDIGSNLSQSFAMAELLVYGSSKATFIGGFVGFLTATLGNESINRSYAWGLVVSQSYQYSDTILGGFAGALFGPAKILLCIAYITMSAPEVGVTAGLLIGVVRSSAADPGQVHFCVAYVAPSGSLKDVWLIEKNDGIIPERSLCARYQNTLGCLPPESLCNAAVFLGFDFKSDFYYDQRVANHSIALRALPVPASHSTIANPAIMLPDSSQWSAAYWVVDRAKLHGYPFVRALTYGPHCGPYIDCHGAGTSPVDADCQDGWASPPRNGTALADSLHRCNVPASAAEGPSGEADGTGS